MTSNGIPARTRASASSPPRPKTNGSPPFSDAAPASVQNQHVVDLLLGQRAARDLHARRLRDELGRDEPVVDEHLGGAHAVEPADGDQAGIAGASADQGDTHPSARSTSRWK
jgi:hypothetical protein